MNKEIARNIILGFISRTNLSYEEKIIEMADVTSDDKKLLEHINLAIEVLLKAKEEINNEMDNR